MRRLHKTFPYFLPSMLAALAIVLLSFIPGIRGMRLEEHLQVADQGSYISNAYHLLADGNFTREPAAPFLWEPYRTPGLPFIISVVLWLHGSLPWIPLINVLFMGAGILYGIKTIRLFTENARVIYYYTVLFALMPNLLGTVCQVLTEPAFCSLCIAWMFYVIRFLKHGRTGDVLLSSVILACAQLIKPTISAAPLLLAVIVCIWFLPSFKKLFSWKIILLLLLSTPAVIFMSLRNYESHGVFKPTLLGEETTREYLTANYLDYRTGEGYYKIQQEIREADHKLALQDTTAGISYYGKLYRIKKAKNDSIMKTDPLNMGKAFVFECIKQVFAPQDAVFLVFAPVPVQPARIAGFILNLLLLLFVLMGCVVLYKKKAGRIILIVILFYGFFIAAGAMSSRQGGRFRLPADMLALPLAATGLYQLLNRKKINSADIEQA